MWSHLLQWKAYLKVLQNYWETESVLLLGLVTLERIWKQNPDKSKAQRGQEIEFSSLDARRLELSSYVDYKTGLHSRIGVSITGYQKTPSWYKETVALLFHCDELDDPLHQKLFQSLAKNKSHDIPRANLENRVGFYWAPERSTCLGFPKGQTQGSSRTPPH